MLKNTIEHIKDKLIEETSFFTNGFSDVIQNPELGLVLKGDVPIFPSDTLGNYFYLRLPNNLTFTQGTGFAIADTITGIAVNAEIVLVACVKDADADVLIMDILNVLRATCNDPNITFVSATYNSAEVVRRELEFMTTEMRNTALQNIPDDLTIVSITFTIQNDIDYNKCETEICKTC